MTPEPADPTPAEILTETFVGIRAPAGDNYKQRQDAERVVASIEVGIALAALSDAGYSIVRTGEVPPWMVDCGPRIGWEDGGVVQGMTSDLDRTETTPLYRIEDQ